MIGNDREISGKIGENLPAVKNERDALAIDMKLKGHSNHEIAEATGMGLKTVQNVLSRGGRLYPVLASLRSEKLQAVRAGNLSAWDTLIEAKDPATEELRRISREDPNSVARLKAIDMILDLTGVRDGERPPLLDPGNPDESQQRFIEWADGLFLRTFRESAPAVILAYRTAVATNEERYKAVMYWYAKTFLWEDSIDDEHYQKRLAGSGYNIEEMEALLKRLEFPGNGEPWAWCTPEQREEIEKHRAKKKGILDGLEKYSAEYSRLLAYQYCQGQDEALEKLRELWSSFQVSNVEATKFLDGLKEERRKGWEENRKEELEWISHKDNVFDEKEFWENVQLIKGTKDVTRTKLLELAGQIEERGEVWQQATAFFMDKCPLSDANEALLFASDIRYYCNRSAKRKDF